MTGLLDALSAEARNALREREQPEWTDPMLATLAHDPFSDPAWVYERKLDGVRCLAFRSGDEVRLLSRNRKDQNPTYPELVGAIAAQSAGDFIVDGEVVAFDGAVTSFSRLQGRMQVRDPDEARATGIAVYYYLFDLLYVDGHDSCGLALRDRKALLRRVIDFDDPLRFTPHRNADGEALLEEACRKGWEGLIAKRADSTYVHRRSRDWLKLKCVSRQELVVGGFTDPKGERIGFGALLVGYRDDGALRYAGKVGTGYDRETLRELRSRLERLERKTSPFDEPVSEKGAHWVTPKLVAEVGFTEWTDDGKLRHPRFIGLRHDKPAGQVVREG